MPDVVTVSSVENMTKLKATIEGLVKNNQYAEITQSIGLHSICIDPKHTLSDQAGLYRFVLNTLKERISGSKGKSYGAWYADFPTLMDKLVSSRQVVTDKASEDVIASHHDAFGAFKSVDDFFFWALDDRRLTLAQIVKYIEKTAETPGK